MTHHHDISSSVICVLLFFFSQGVDAATVQYPLTIDGGADFADLQPGEHTLGIWGQVVDNEIEGGRNGGILLFSVNIDASEPSSVDFEANVSDFPASNTWKSSFPSVFSTTFRGKRDAGGYVVGAHTGSIGAANFGDHPFTVGSNAPSLLTSGKFTWDGAPATLEVIPGELTGHLIFTDLGGGNFGAGYPDRATGMSVWLGVPEPAAGSLALALLIGNATWVRRRA